MRRQSIVEAVRTTFLEVFIDDRVDAFLQDGFESGHRPVDHRIIVEQPTPS